MLYGFLIILFLVVLDQITKFWIVNTITYRMDIPIIEGFFNLSYQVNDGAAWSIFRGQMVFFYLISIIALGIFFYFFKDVNFKTKKVYSFGVSFLIAGTLGNFIDRVRIQGVIDFLDFKIFGYDFPVFNVADICLNLGIALFIIAILFFDE